MAALSSVHKADRIRLEDVEANIVELEQALMLLRTERAAIQGRLAAYKYPVLTLPNEIVSEIFVHFLPSYPDCPSATGLLSPTLLTHVCRKWRQIALNTPVLWRAILSVLSPTNLVRSTDRIQRVESWLERSCFCPVSVIFKFQNNAYDVQEEDLRANLQTLLPHRLRWEYLELWTFPQLISIIEGPTPLLRILNMSVFVHPSSPLSLTDTSPLCLTEAPLLRTALLNDLAAAHVTLPWAQLTSLTLHNVYPSECTPVLLQTFNLVHCQLNLVEDNPEPIQPDINLLCLESLILGDYAEDPDAEPTKYLGTFIAPALRKLEVSEMFIGTDHVTQLTSFVAKSGCNLQEIRITGHKRSTPEALYRNALPLVPKMFFDFTAATRTEYDSEDEGDEESEGDQDE
ncbi:hypothetical protein C8R43DRAFT_343377 [Mycena crocata]|nr:hypothetical protein C8R43DRAFT_343377 [Mycena crocata]